jgi:hypothetical protein
MGKGISQMEVQEFANKINLFVKFVEELKEMGFCPGNAENNPAQFSLSSVAEHAKKYNLNPVIKKTDHSHYEYTITIPELNIYAIGSLSEIIRHGLVTTEGSSEYEKSEFARMRIKILELERENAELKEQ